MRTAAKLGGRLGEDRQAGNPRKMGEGLAQLGIELATGDDHPGAGVADVLCDLLEHEFGGLYVKRRNRGQRPHVASFQSQWIGCRHRAIDGNRRERLAPGKIEMDRARPGLAAGGGERPAGDRTEVEQPFVIGLVRADLAEPAHRGPVDLHLVDRLPGADPAQLRRPVGGQRDQWNRGLVGLADRGVEVCCCRAGGAEHRHRCARRLRRPEREVRRGALIDDHGHVDLRLAPERHRQRGGAGAGGNDRLTQPAARQLLDEGGGQGGIAVRRVHASLTLNAVGLQRRLVDLHAQSRARGQVEHPIP